MNQFLADEGNDNLNYNFYKICTIFCVSVQVNYSREVQWFSCFLENIPDTKTTIRIAVVPAKSGTEEGETREISDMLNQHY